MLLLSYNRVRDHKIHGCTLDLRAPETSLVYVTLGTYGSQVWSFQELLALHVFLFAVPARRVLAIYNWKHTRDVFSFSVKKNGKLRRSLDTVYLW